MRKSVTLTLFFLFFSSFLIAQQAQISGKIINGKTKETLPGVNVILNENTGVVSDIDGNYNIKVNPGQCKLTFKFIGFGTVQRTYNLIAGQEIVDNITLLEESLLIEGVVVSAGKFEQKISEVTVSMSVLKPEQITNKNINILDEAINKLPGVDIYDGQPSIRSGSGYSYGAGSRVLVLVDDMPILSPDAGDAKWNFMPIENISQVEVIKGASSALFGSSALNGVINLRTSYPIGKPHTRISVNSGVYMNPRRKELVWWDDTDPEFNDVSATVFACPLSNFGVKNPGFGGLDFSHSRKIGNFDLVVGGNLFEDQGFRDPNGEQHIRANSNLRYRAKKIQGLSFGLNVNYMYAKKTSFFLWQNADSGALRQNPDAITRSAGYRINLDPYFLYFNKKGSKYSLKLRYYRQTNSFADDPGKNNNADIYYGDYQYQHNFKGIHNLTSGISGSYSHSEAELFGKHDGLNISLYAQYDAKFWKKLTVSLGIRGEYFRIDTAQSESTFSYKIKGKNHTVPFMPVFRAGINYQAAKFTFIRASFGQGYRFPSMAEKFISTSVGGLNIFPNKLLEPETGWSAELGVKQGVKLGNWNGYLDLAGFWTEYSNMIEFTFGTYIEGDTIYSGLEDYIKKYIGFKSLNVGHARINGIDFTFTGQGKLFGFPSSILIGYTFTNPIDLSKDSTKSDNNKYLKYRFLHSVKGDFEVTFGIFTLGIGFIYNSNMINIDKAFEGHLIPELSSIINTQLLPGLKEYRDQHNKGHCLFNVRGLFDITETQRIGLFVNNVFNTEYMTRPGYIEAPRNIAVQYVLNF
jgi:outer membrane cobalamin receptor